MKRFFLSMIILLCLNSGNVLSKTVTLKYKAGYSVTCSIENKEVVNASDFLLLDIHGNEIVKGTVKSISPQLLIAGNYHFTEGTVDVLSFGDFSISNTAGDGFTINERKGSTLVISPISIRSAYFSGEKREISFTDSDATSMLLTIDWLASSKDTESAIKKLSVRVANNLISAYGYTAIDNLLQNTPSGYTIEWTNGISFNGNISHYNDSDGSLSLEEGTLSSTSCTETIKRGTEKDTFVYSREETNTSSAAINKMVITVPERVVKAYNYWNVPQIINRGLTGTFFLNGGDSFDGEYSAPIENGQITKISFNKGTYQWGTGDVFVGNYSGKSFGGIPIDGVLTLAAGETLRGQWWKDMQFSEKEWNEFLAYQSPSEKLSFYKRVSTENIVKKAIDSIRTLLSEGDVPQAITIVNEYGELAHSSSQKEAWQEVLLLLNGAEESTPLENISDSETIAVQPKPSQKTSHTLRNKDSTIMTTGETIVVIVIAILLLVCIALIVRKIITVIKAIKITINRLKDQKRLLDDLKSKLTQVEREVLMAHSSFCEAFYYIRRRCKTMLVASREATDNWRSSAKTTVDLVQIQPRFGHYRSLKVPYNIPKIPINNTTTYYIYPSFLLVDCSGHLTAYENSDVDFNYSNHRIVVDASDVTRETEVVDYTYRYVNYDGSPDGRFANNDKRPIVLYGNVEILPLGEELVVDKRSAAKDLCDSFLNLKKAIQKAETERLTASSFNLYYPPIITPE